jgi:hypothetical protein
MRTLAVALTAVAIAAGVAASPASAQSPPPVVLEPSQLVFDRFARLRPDVTIAGLDLDRSRGKLTVSVMNSGLPVAPASTTRAVVILRNPITYMTRIVRVIQVPTGALAFRQTRTYVLDLDGRLEDFPVSPFLEITVTADADNTVAESDETNNAQTVLGRNL